LPAGTERSIYNISSDTRQSLPAGNKDSRLFLQKWKKTFAVLSSYIKPPLPAVKEENCKKLYLLLNPDFKTELLK
jgi:hypothetical protein